MVRSRCLCVRATRLRPRARWTRVETDLQHWAASVRVDGVICLAAIVGGEMQRGIMSLEIAQALSFLFLHGQVVVRLFFGYERHVCSGSEAPGDGYDLYIGAVEVRRASFFLRCAATPLRVGCSPTSVSLATALLGEGVLWAATATSVPSPPPRRASTRLGRSGPRFRARRVPPVSATLRLFRALLPALPCRPGTASWGALLRSARRPFTRAERRCLWFVDL